MEGTRAEGGKEGDRARETPVGLASTGSLHRRLQQLSPNHIQHSLTASICPTQLQGLK